MLIAARVAPLTTHIGLVPTVVATHTEPFHLSKAIATLDYVSTGRAGVRVQVSAKPHEAAHFGRRDVPADRLGRQRRPADGQALIAELFDEAADYVEVRAPAVGQLGGRRRDPRRRHRPVRRPGQAALHRLRGRLVLASRGPSITPRPPQGQPLVAALAHASRPVPADRRASADVGFVTPHDADDAAAIVAEIRAEQARRRPGRETVHVFGDLVVFLDDTDRRPPRRAGPAWTSWPARAYTSDAAHLRRHRRRARRPAARRGSDAGLTGFRLRPAALPHDLTADHRGLVPELQRRGAVPHRATRPTTLRGLLGPARPANRYAAA